MGRVSDAKERLMKAVAELIWTGSYGSTTIDQICERAGVRKGSFYHFFESKSEVAALAIQKEWESCRAELDRLFSPTAPPLLRLRRFCQHAYREQVELKRQFGHVLGCPLCNLGTEISTRESELRQTVQHIMTEAQSYFVSAVRDAQGAGLLKKCDAATKARALYAYSEGLLTQARIQDDTEVLLEMERGMLDILGVPNATHSVKT